MEYSLVSVNGNAYAIMAYVQQAMENCRFSEQEVNTYMSDATRSDYNNLLCVSQNMLDMCNERG